MSKYIDAEKLYEYLEQVSEFYPRYADNFLDNAVINVINGIKTFIASLQQEQPEVDLNLEHEIQLWLTQLHNRPTSDELRAFATHFYELGLNARKEE